MSSHTLRFFSRVLPCFVLTGLTTQARADYKDDIGYTALVQELTAQGVVIPNGTGVTVTQAEASVGSTTDGSTTTYQYLPTSGWYTGVTFTNQTDGTYGSATSGHADMVGNLIYGDGSTGSGISQVTTYYVDYWLKDGLLRYTSGNSSAPLVETNDIENHSWVGTTGSAAVDKRIINRLDYAIERDDFVAVVGVNNEVNVDKNLLSAAYNVISVGVSSGNHSSTPTSAVNAGLQRPLIVAPAGTTSEATAIVSSAASLLIQQARSSSTTSANGAKSETIKAIMLAGATKSEFANWSRTDTLPIDSVYGAGELNVQNNYHIMAAGEQTPSATSSSLVAATGWDYNNITNGQTVSYYFNLTATSDVSVALTWNALYTGSNYNNLTLTLANLDLYLYEVGSGGSLTLLQQSISSAENLEYIWKMALSGGSYVIQVKSTAGGSDYAVAWQSSDTAQAIPEPSSVVLVIAGAGVLIGIAIRRRQTSLS